MAAEDHLLQSGIHWQGGLPKTYRLLLLNIRPGTSARDLHRALDIVWSMLASLRNGQMRDFEAQRRQGEAPVVVDGQELAYVLGFGRRLFDADIHQPQLIDPALRPRFLRYLGDAPFKALKWTDAADLSHNPKLALTTQSDLALQFTAQSELAANRAIVEMHKLIVDQSLPLEIARFMCGFRREDHRSWIDFHDGINNMSHAQRRIVVESIHDEQAWMRMGTYMACLQIRIDLDGWWRLPRSEQEALVGRDKFSGCPLQSVTVANNGSMSAVIVPSCPFTGNFGQETPPDVIDPGQASDRIVAASHIHRANLLRLDPIKDTDSDNRIYRQGFEFLENGTDGRIKAGLNFVGFMRSLRIINDVLSSPGWMGDVNFGGPHPPSPGDPQAFSLMSILHGGFYAVPPLALPFPGAAIISSN